MNVKIGIELVNEQDLTVSKQQVNLIANNGLFLVVASPQDLLLLKNKNIDFETFDVIEIEHIKKFNVFDDYGFKGSNGLHYLYGDVVVLFSVKAGEKDQLDMALLQWEEHLIAIDLKHSIYVCDKHFSELIIGISKAYDIEVSFFDLDKHKKNN